MKRILYPLVAFYLPAQAQFSVLGADAFGRANSLVSVPGYSSMYQNPAGIAEETSGFLAFHYLRILPVAGFHTTGVQGVFARKTFTYGFSADSFGDRHYRESRVGLALARQQDRVSLGVKMSYVNSSGASARAWMGEAGMVVTPAPYVRFGLRILQLASSRWYAEQSLPSVLAVGVSLSPNSRVSLSGQLDYFVRESAEFRCGLHYKPRDQLGFSMGVNPAGRSLHFGTEIAVGRYGLLYSMATHPYVGLAHHTTFIYKLHE